MKEPNVEKLTIEEIMERYPLTQQQVEEIRNVQKGEKIYHFTQSRGIDNQIQISVKESELTKQQKDLLFAEVVMRYNDLPSELQYKFIKECIVSVK